MSELARAWALATTLDRERDEFEATDFRGGCKRTFRRVLKRLCDGAGYPNRTHSPLCTEWIRSGDRYLARTRMRLPVCAACALQFFKRSAS